jgi:hypothetical protein
MKVLCELPNLEKLIEVGKQRGFTIEVPEITLASYRVKVSCDGVQKSAYVDHKRHRGITILDTGGGHWRGEEALQQRLRISIGKRITVIGNKLKWTMSKFAAKYITRDEPDNTEVIVNNNPGV